MVASNIRKAARKDARQRLLEQVKREDKRKKLDNAVFGEFEKDEEEAQDSSDEDSGSEGGDAPGEGATLHLDQDTEMNGTDEAEAKPKKGHVTKEEAKALKKARKQKKKEEAEAREAEKAKVRFICFVGKLPYSATTESIRKHFAKIEPTEIRHSTQRGSDKSRGFAFLEFDNYKRMNDCLRLYHHTTFDDGLGGEPRKINIELTAGGGGNKSKERKERIKTKNAKLKEERKKKKEAKKELKREKREKKEAPKRDKTKYNNRRGKWAAHRIQAGTGANAIVAAAPATSANGGSSAQDGGGIHPSRLARMQEA